MPTVADTTATQEAPMSAASETLDARFPYKDRNGYPLGVDSYVRVNRYSATFGNISFAGLVTKAEDDPNHGTLLTIRVWIAGAWSGGERLARPEQCEVRRKPKSLREALEAVVGAKLRLQAAAPKPKVRR
jgi:hypothetical protein